jgi:hypothetical protein
VKLPASQSGLSASVLLRQPDCFEGFGYVGVEVTSCQLPVAQRPDVGNAFIDWNPSALAASAKTHDDGDAIIDVDELLRLNSVLLEHRIELPCEVHDALLTLKWPGGKGGEQSQLEIGRDEVGGNGRWPTVCKPVIETSNHLQVLLRHRLFREAGGLEGLRPFAEILDSHHPSSAEGHDLVVQLFVYLCPASLASSVVAKPGRHLVPSIDKLLRFQPQLRERFVKSLPKVLDLVRTLARVKTLARGEHPLDLRIKGLNGGVEVTTVVGLDEISGFVDVLLRNTPSPALRMGDFMCRV